MCKEDNVFVEFLTHFVIVAVCNALALRREDEKERECSRRGCHAAWCWQPTASSERERGSIALCHHDDDESQ